MTANTPTSPAVEGVTERFDPIACLDERVRQDAAALEAAAPGRYVQVQGTERTLLIPVGEELLHVGRGISSGLRLDESSVSRRHAILVPRPGGVRILDDRSSNGTLVNGRRIESHDLRNGDVIVLGRVMLRYVEI